MFDPNWRLLDAACWCRASRQAFQACQLPASLPAGLATRDPETVQIAGILPFFVLMFASNVREALAAGSPTQCNGTASTRLITISSSAATDDRGGDAPRRRRSRRRRR
jgi:hypothetical protein